jgi:hypothetical protein
MKDLYNFQTTGSYQVDDRVFPTLDRNYVYDNAKIKAMKTLRECNLPDGWYGGNVQLICELEDSPVILFVDTSMGFRVFSTGILGKNLKGYLESLDLKTLRNLAKIKNCEVDIHHSKEKVVEAFFRQ